MNVHRKPADYVIVDVSDLGEQFGLWLVDGREYRLSDLIPDMYATIDYLYVAMSNVNMAIDNVFEAIRAIFPEDDDVDDLEEDDPLLGAIFPDPYVTNELTRQAAMRLAEILFQHFKDQGMYGPDGYLMYELQSDLGAFSPVFKLAWDRTNQTLSTPTVGQLSGNPQYWCDQLRDSGRGKLNKAFASL